MDSDIPSVFHHGDVSPSRKARMIGVLFLVTIVAGIIAQVFIGERLIDLDDAASTTANIAGNRTLYRFAFTLYMVEMTAQIAWILLMFDLLRPVDPSVARIATTLGLTGCGIKTFSRVFHYAPLLLVSGGPALAGLGEEQLQAVSLVLLRLNDQGAAIAVIFFGFESVLEGWLIIRSTFLPRFLGFISVAGGLGWLTFIWPPLGYDLFTVVAPVALLGSLLTIGWFLTKGVDEARWVEQARAAEGSIWR